MDFSNLSELGRIGAAALLVLVSAAIIRWQRVGLEGDVLVASVRAFVQLIAIGYLLQAVFANDHPAFILIILSVMALIGAYTAGQRGGAVPRAAPVAFAAIVTGALLNLGLLVLLGVFQAQARFLIPVGGMVIGNAMTTCGLVLARLGDEIKQGRPQIEAALALGATSRQAIAPQLRRVLKNGLLPVVDSTKIVGIIQLPGTMTGMILGGASPLEAVQTQIIILYLLLGGSAFAGLIAALLGYRGFFSPAHQLLRPEAAAAKR